MPDDEEKRFRERLREILRQLQLPEEGRWELYVAIARVMTQQRRAAR